MTFSEAQKFKGRKVKFLGKEYPNNCPKDGLGVIESVESITGMLLFQISSEKSKMQTWTFDLISFENDCILLEEEEEKSVSNFPIY